MRHYSFRTAPFGDTIAHGGTGQIRTCRVEARGQVGLADFIDMTVLPAGTSIGLHTHDARDEEIYVVVSGQGLMTLDGECFPVGPGDVVVNRPGGTHGLENTGETDLFLVVVEIGANNGD
jgi:mannose-6-phosphate isomerase-like protein (cupin superfamily)